MTGRAPPPTHPARLGVFTSREAAAAGWTPEGLEHAVRRGRLVRLRRGVYVAADLDEGLHAADRTRRRHARLSIGAALVTRGAAVNGLAAATVRGWPVWAPAERACLHVAGGTSSALRDVHVHRDTMPGDATLAVDGYRLTGAGRTVVDVAREFGTEAGLVVADAAVAAGATTPDRIRHEITRLAGRPGIGRARPLADLVDARAESVLESRSRWQFVVHDLPAPRPQMWLYDLEGRFLGRTDFLWEVGVVGEVDGAAKLEDAAARTALLQRQLGLGRVGLRVVRWGEPQLRSFDPTAAWLREELAAAAADPGPRRWVASEVRLGSKTVLRGLPDTVRAPNRR